MRVLLKILLGGFLAFMVLAIADEWAFFYASWFGETEPPAELSEVEQKAAADALHETLTLMRHYYLSGGDPRFTERMPAGEWIIEELKADALYLGRHHLIQDTDLQRLDVMSVDVLSEDRLELTVRELWRVRLLRAADRMLAEEPRLQQVEGTYLLVRTGRGWRVDGWEPNLTPQDGEGP